MFVKKQYVCVHIHNINNHIATLQSLRSAMKLTLGYLHLQDPKLQRSSRLHHSILTTIQLPAVLNASICQGKVVSVLNLLILNAF